MFFSLDVGSSVQCFTAQHMFEPGVRLQGLVDRQRRRTRKGKIFGALLLAEGTVIIATIVLNVEFS